MAKLLQIYEDDLADLEKTLPEITNPLIDKMDNVLRTKIRRVQKILSDVRWNYGPPTDVERIDCDG